MFTLRMLGPACALGLVIACSPASSVVVEHSQAPLREGAYVWQRAWTPPVDQAVADHDFDTLAVLSHEVAWQGRQPQIHRVDLSPGRLSPQTVYTVRVGVPPEGVDLPETLSAVFGEVCPRGRVHLDMDMPTRRLAEYAEWVEVLSAGCDLRITALPTWLDHPSFSDVGRAGFVLQVHWFNPAEPRGPLLQANALAAIERAARYGIAFEVALPAYGHRIWMRGDRLVSMESEQASSAPTDARSELIMADPHAVSKLVTSLRGSHPASLRGLWWFRLPTSQDQLAWAPATLAAVRAGEALEARTERVSEPIESGAESLCVRNRGNLAWLPEPIPVDAALAGGRLGWTFSPGRHALVPPPISRPLQPGETRCVGWIRNLVNHAL